MQCRREPNKLTAVAPRGLTWSPLPVGEGGWLPGLIPHDTETLVEGRGGGQGRGGDGRGGEGREEERGGKGGHERGEENKGWEGKEDGRREWVESRGKQQEGGRRKEMQRVEDR